jgi:DNA polymerase III delta prime subunit
MDISNLREQQNHFETGRASTSEAQQLYKQSEELVSQFQQKFSLNKLRSMTLEDYVEGHQSKDSFCYWLEHKTDPVGKFMPGGSGYGFNVYYSQKKGAYIIQEGNQGKTVSIDEASKRLEIIKTGLIELLNFAETKDFVELRRISKQLQLGQHTIGKILCLYFPDKYLSLFSNRHMNEFLNIFGLLDEGTKSSDAFEKREILLAFKEKDQIMKNWSNRKYVDFLYREIFKNEQESYFILRTGGGEYSDEPENKYNFKEGIPGSVQLRNSERKAQFVYLQEGNFYATGSIGKISSYNKDQVVCYDAEIQDYKKIGPVRYNDVNNKLSIETLGQAGIIQISKQDFQTIVSQLTVPPVKVPKSQTLQQLSANIFYAEELIADWATLLEERKQIIFYGPPGTGKTFVAENFGRHFLGNNGEMRIIQFHPSYSYEDFVEGIRPKITKGNNGSAQVEYEFNIGVLKALCQSAINNSEKKFILLIDEINRGNIAKIFGELIHCLEYRGEDHKVLLPYTQEEFFIPNNLYLIGTMNSADRSLALVDYALRRRFCFIAFMPDEQILQKWLDQNKISVDKGKLIDFLHKINLKIREDEKLGKHFQVGHSYFMRKNLDRKKLEGILNYNILPLLEEYYFEDEEAIKDVQKVFNDSFNSSSTQNATVEQINPSSIPANEK